MNVHVFGASLSEPHTSKNLVQLSCIQKAMRKSEQYPYLVGTIVHVAKESKHSLLMLLICLLESFVFRRMTS